MKVMNRYHLWLLLLAMLCGLTWSGPAVAQQVERIGIDEMLSRLGEQDLVVLDVRTGRDWEASDLKIKGAVRPQGDIVSWAEQYPRDTVLVLYCS